MRAPGERSVRLRRGPRVWRVVATGAVLGLVVAVVLTFAFPRTGSFGTGAVLGFLALFGIALGALVGGLVAVLLDRASRRRARSAVVQRERIRVPREDQDS